MVSKHGSYLVFLLISGLPIKPGRTSGAMLVQASVVIVVEGSAAAAQYTKTPTLFIKKIEMLFNK